MPHTLNRAELIGFLGQDPDLKYTAQGTAVCDLRIATDESYTRDGERVEQTEWHSVTCWGRLAEICNEHLSCGDRVYACGPMETTEWEMDGEEHSERYMNADEVIFLGDAGDQSSSGQPQKEPAGAQSGGSGKDQEQFEPDDQLPF